MKKKLAALDPRIQYGAIALLLIVFAAGVYTQLVSPQGAAATKVQAETDAVQVQIYQRRAELRKGANPPTIETADLFRLARAMPDQTDMPGIILTLSELARSAGIKFNSIEPAGGSPGASYATQRIHLLFNGDFYGLSDFLYRVRSLVSVHDGTLDANGRLFNVDTVTFSMAAETFPKISAEIYLNAYVYGSATPATPAAPTTTDSTTTNPDTTTTPAAGTDTPPAGATAAGATP
jgi:Tfp pilus assembly protein PilO